MAKIGWRVRSLAWVLAHAPLSAVSQMTPEQLLKAQERLAAHPRLAVGVTGRLAKGVTTENRAIDRPDGALTVRIYRPERLDDGGPVIVHFHGGGWTLGALDQSDWLCSQVAPRRRRRRGVGGLPAGADASLPERGGGQRDAVLVGRRARAGPGRRSDRLAVMGDSAGGNLATVVCQILRDRSGPPIAYQALMYPATDLRTPADFDAANPAQADYPILSSASMVSFRDHYLGPDGDPEEPTASPIFAEDCPGLPPALIQVAEFDPLRDDGIRYAARCRHAGVTVRLTEYVGLPHGYFSFPKVIRGTVVQALAEVCAEQRYALHSDPAPATFPRVVVDPETERVRAADEPVDPVASRRVDDHAVGRHQVPQHHAEQPAG